MYVELFFILLKLKIIQVLYYHWNFVRIIENYCNAICNNLWSMEFYFKYNHNLIDGTHLRFMKKKDSYISFIVFCIQFPSHNRINVKMFRTNFASFVVLMIMIYFKGQIFIEHWRNHFMQEILFRLFIDMSNR